MYRKKKFNIKFYFFLYYCLLSETSLTGTNDIFILAFNCNELIKTIYCVT